MARIKYTVAFPAARPGDEVTWPNTVHVYPDANTPVPLQSGQSLNESLSFSGWSDATSVVFARPAGDNDTVTVTSGSPSGTGAAVPAPPGGSTPVPLAVQFKAQAFFTSGGGRSTNVYLHAESLLFDGVNNTGNLFDSVSSGSLPVGAGQQVIAPTACTISGIPDSEDGIDLDIYIVVTNQDGTEAMRVSTNVVVPPHTSSYAVQMGPGGDFSTDWTVGTDLSASGPIITSAAGGLFTANVYLDVVWD